MIKRKANQRLLSFLLNRSGASTQQELAAEIGIPRAVMGDALRGRAITVPYITSIAAYFCLTNDQLCDDAVEPSDKVIERFLKKKLDSNPSESLDEVEDGYWEMEIRRFGRLSAESELEAQEIIVSAHRAASCRSVISLKERTKGSIVYHCATTEEGLLDFITAFIKERLQPLGIFELAFEVPTGFQQFLAKLVYERHLRAKTPVTLRSPNGTMTSVKELRSRTAILRIEQNGSRVCMGSTMSPDNIRTAEALVEQVKATSKLKATNAVHSDREEMHISKLADQNKGHLAALDWIRNNGLASPEDQLYLDWALSRYKGPTPFLNASATKEFMTYLDHQLIHYLRLHPHGNVKALPRKDDVTDTFVEDTKSTSEE